MCRKSKWFEGLKLAESMGYEEAKWYVPEFDYQYDDPDFIQGFMDYIAYHKAVIQPRLVDGQAPS